METRRLWYNILVRETNSQSKIVYLEKLLFKKFGYQGGKEGGTNWEIGVDIYTLLYIK